MRYLSTVQPQNDAEWCRSLYECLSGKNMTIRHFGFSPCQHAFGREPKLAANLLDEQMCPGANSMARADDVYGQAARRRMLARPCWLEAMELQEIRCRL